MTRDEILALKGREFRIRMAEFCGYTRYDYGVFSAEDEGVVGWMVIVEREAVMRVHQRYQWEEKRITLTQEELCKITKATQEV